MISKRNKKLEGCKNLSVWSDMKQTFIDNLQFDKRRTIVDTDVGRK